MTYRPPDESAPPMGASTLDLTNQMNAVEIEEAVSDLVQQPFEAAEFPFQFITAFGAKKATIDRLRATKNGTNQSNVGGVLQRNKIHIGIAPTRQVGATLAALRAGPKTVSATATSSRAVQPWRAVVAAVSSTLAFADRRKRECDHAGGAPFIRSMNARYLAGGATLEGIAFVASRHGAGMVAWTS
jgi:hypothetical protein